MNPKSLDIFDVRVDVYNLEEALQQVDAFVRLRSDRARKVCFVNVHSIQLAKKDIELKRCIREADLVLADGSGLRIAARVISNMILHNLNGTDFTPHVLAAADHYGWSVYLIGARPGIVEKCAGRLSTEYPRLHIAGAHHGYLNAGNESSVLADINRLKPDILLVAMGSPIQEKWIDRHAPGLNVAVALAVGGLFDFMSGEIDRAPHWMRKLGVEWMHRFFQNPRGKWNRIFVEIPVFLARVYSYKMIHRFFQVQPHAAKPPISKIEDEIL